MSETEEGVALQRPPDAAPPTTSRLPVFGHPQSKSSGNKMKIATSFARRIGKLFTGIKRGPGSRQPVQHSVPPARAQPINAPVAFSAAPNYGRFSEKLTAALSSNTNSGSSVARGGSDSELPVFANASSLPGGDSPTATRSPLWSPSFLGASSTSSIKFHHVLQSPPEEPTSPAAAAAAAAAAAGLIGCRTSPYKQGAAGATAVRDLAVNQTSAAQSRTPHGKGDVAPQKLHHAAAAAGSTSLFSCLIGDPRAACDLPVTINHLHRNHQRQTERQLQPQHKALALAQACSAPAPDAITGTAADGDGAPASAPPSPFGTAKAGEIAAAAAEAASLTAAALPPTPPQVKDPRDGWAAGDRDSPARPVFARSSGSDSLLMVGRAPSAGVAPHRPFQSPHLQQQQPQNQQQRQQLQPDLDPHLRALIQQSPKAGTCVIQSPGGTPRALSPVGSWMSHGSTRKLQPAPEFDRPSAARHLAYRPPEVLAAAAATARAGGVGGAGGEGRVRGGQQAAVALLGGGSCVSAGDDCSASAVASASGDNGRPEPVPRSASTLQAAHPGRGKAASQRLVTAAETAAGSAASAAAAAAAAAALPSLLKAEFLIRGQLEPMLSIPISSSGGGIISNVVSTPQQLDSTCTTATAVGPSSSSSSSCNSRMYDSNVAGTSPASSAAAAAAAAPAASGDKGGSRAPPRQQPRPPPIQTKPSPSSQILAANPGMPAAMRRSHWSLDDFTVTKRLYKGSSSAVYKAVCNRSGLPVALKVYFLNRVPSAVLHMICREIEIHAAVSHPNILMLYAAFQCDRHLTLVLEYAHRGDLYGILQSCQNRRMDERQVKDAVMAPLLDAVSYLHHHGFCHRDIKPENVLFTSDWSLKLADFGVSIDLSKERAVTRAGTVSYMAPEVARCPLKVRPDDNKEDPRLAYGTACDVWALGVLAYELLVGFTPLGAPALTAGGGLEAPIRPALIFPGGISGASREFIAWALADQPQERPSAAQLRRHDWIRTEARQVPAPAPAVFAPNTPRGIAADLKADYRS